jgi:flagellar biosynthetic protein FliR
MNLLEHLNVFMLVVVRLSAFFLVIPGFSMRQVPPFYKIGLAFFLAFVSYPFITVAKPVPLDASYILFIAKEALFGLAFAFVAALMLYAIQIAGGFIDYQTGFAIANVIDPVTGAQTPLLGQFKYVLAMLLFFTVNGHHLLIKGILKSFALFPIDRLHLPFSGLSFLMFLTEVFSRMFSAAFLMALPVVACLFLTDVALGILARTVPQLNVFVVGLPLKTMFSFLLILFALPAFFYFLYDFLKELFFMLEQFLHLSGAF